MRWDPKSSNNAYSGVVAAPAIKLCARPLCSNFCKALRERSESIWMKTSTAHAICGSKQSWIRSALSKRLGLASGCPIAKRYTPHKSEGRAPPGNSHNDPPSCIPGEDQIDFGRRHASDVEDGELLLETRVVVQPLGITFALLVAAATYVACHKPPEFKIAVFVQLA